MRQAAMRQAAEVMTAPATQPLYEWTLPEALSLVRGLQPKVKEYRYHVALGGGVLNNGSSTKDVDLYFLTLDTGPGDAAKLEGFLCGLFGNTPTVIGSDNLNYPPHAMYRRRLMFRDSKTGRRIDTFIV